MAQPVERAGGDVLPYVGRYEVKSLGREPSGPPHALEVLRAVDLDPGLFNLPAVLYLHTAHGFIQSTIRSATLRSTLPSATARPPQCYGGWKDGSTAKEGATARPPQCYGGWKGGRPVGTPGNHGSIARGRSNSMPSRLTLQA